MKSWVRLQKNITSNIILEMIREGVQRDIILMQLGKLLFLDELLSDDANAHFYAPFEDNGSKRLIRREVSEANQIRQPLFDIRNYTPQLN